MRISVGYQDRTRPWLTAGSLVMLEIKSLNDGSWWCWRQAILVDCG